MSIYLHVGLPKAASTFLQNRLFLNLDQEKIVYNPPEIIDTVVDLLINFNKCNEAQVLKAKNIIDDEIKKHTGKKINFRGRNHCERNGVRPK